MNNVNISLNKTLISIMKETITKKGYNNVSEYIRDLVRRDLHLEEPGGYPYDYAFLKELEHEATGDLKAGRVKELKTWNALTTRGV